MIILDRRRKWHNLIVPWVVPICLFFLVTSLLIGVGIIFFLWKAEKTASIRQSFYGKYIYGSLVELQELFYSRRNVKDPVVRWETQLSFCHLNTRPDAITMDEEEKKPRIHLGVKGKKEEMISLCSGESITLNDLGLEAPCRISAVPLENGAFVEACIDGKIYTVVLDQEEKSACLDPTLKWISSLQEARFWIDDVLLNVYSTSLKENVCKIEIDGWITPVTTPLSSDEYFIYTLGGWRKGDLKAAKGVPVAQVARQVGSYLILSLWDESGFNRQEITIPLAQQESYTFTSLEDVFTRRRCLDGRRIHAVMGKKRISIAPGDWWMKTERGFRLLKKQNEIEDYLHFRTIGELFIVDEIDLSHGKKRIKGHQFDPSRRQMQPVSLSIEDKSKISGYVTRAHPKQSLQQAPIFQERKEKNTP